jgi:uncharacterized protein (TIGR02246 family)
MIMLYLITLIAALGVVPVETEDEAIRATVEAREVAWNERDLDVLVEQLTSSCCHIDSTGRVTEGRDAISERYQELFRESEPSSVHYTVQRIALLTPTVAVLDAGWKLKLDESEEREGSSSLVLIKSNDKWSIAHLRSTAHPSSE